MIAADELSSLLETVHLLRSPKNAARLLAAIAEAEMETGESQSIEGLRQELGLE